jgi:uncharacterized protein
MMETTEEFEAAQDGLKRIEEATIRLLEKHPEGLRNCEIAEELGLRSEFRGKQQDYLTYSILGGLLRKGQVTWDQKTKLFTKAK